MSGRAYSSTYDSLSRNWSTASNVRRTRYALTHFYRFFIISVESTEPGFLIWNGDSTIAGVTITGGSWDANYLPENMFDDDTDTLWHSAYNFPVDHSTITITFNEPVIIFQIQITARKHINEQNRYRNICIFLDGTEDKCTDGDRVTKGRELIPITIAGLTPVTVVMIRFPYRQYAEVSELAIIYEEGNYFRILADIFLTSSLMIHQLHQTLVWMSHINDSIEVLT